MCVDFVVVTGGAGGIIGNVSGEGQVNENGPEGAGLVGPEAFDFLDSSFFRLNPRSSILVQLFPPLKIEKKLWFFDVNTLRPYGLLH